jgi:hypothetical protein
MSSESRSEYEEKVLEDIKAWLDAITVTDGKVETM